MPKIRRWFHVSHDINADPEVWILRRSVGEKALSIWLEILSIADRNDGFLLSPETPESQVSLQYYWLVRSVAGRCQSTGRTVSAVCDFAISHLWLVYDPTLRVRNHAKYRVSREDHKIPSGNAIIFPPTPTPTPTHPIPPIVPQGTKNSYSDGFQHFWSTYPNKVGKDGAWKSWKRHQLETEAEVIIRSVEEHRTWQKWQEENGKFIPHPSTFLNQGRWKDEPTQNGARPGASAGTRCESCQQKNPHVRYQHWLTFSNEDELKQHFYQHLGLDEGHRIFCEMLPWWKTKKSILEMQPNFGDKS